MSKILDLAALSAWIGAADGLSAFFITHVRGCETGRDFWIKDLARSLLLGTALTGVMVMLLGVGLLGLHRLVALAISRRRGLAAIPAPNAYYRKLAVVAPGISIALLTSNMINVFLIIALISCAAVLVAAALLPVARLLDRMAPLLPGAVTLLVIVTFWYSGASFFNHRFSSMEQYSALWKAGLPLMVWPLAWSLCRGRRRPPALGAAFIFGIAWLGMLAPASRRPAPKEATSVLMIMVDTLRTDRAWGPSSLMPVVKRLAEQGVYYANAHTALPKTQQSVSSIMTGLYPWHNGVRQFKSVLRPSQETLAERFGRAGYRTAAFVHNPWIDYGMGHEQGFDEYVDYHRLESPFGLQRQLLPVRLAARLDGRIGEAKRNRLPVDGAHLTDAALAWLAENQHAPYFLWLHYFDPHWPYEPPEAFPGVAASDRKLAEHINGKAKSKTLFKMRFEMEKSGIRPEEVAAAIRLYDREVAYADTQIARLLDHINGHNPPLIVFMTDHGESLGEHGYYFFHGNFTYDVCLKIPIILVQPGRLPKGVIVNEQVRAVDLLPTLARLVGLEPGRTDGRLLPGLGLPESDAHLNRIVPFEADARGRRKVKRIPLAGDEGRWRGVIKDGIKMIAVPFPEGFHYELYDLKQDPKETRNIFNGRLTSIRPYLDAMTASGLEMWNGEKEKHSAGHKSPTSEDGDDQNLSEEEEERLRGLGYLQ